MELLSSFEALSKKKKKKNVNNIKKNYIAISNKVDIIYPILLVREGNIFVVLKGSSVNLEIDIRDQ